MKQSQLHGKADQRQNVSSCTPDTANDGRKANTLPNHQLASKAIYR